MMPFSTNTLLVFDLCGLRATTEYILHSYLTFHLKISSNVKLL